MIKILHTMTWFAPGGGVDKELIIHLRHQCREFDVTLLVGRNRYHNEFEKIEGLNIEICPFLVAKFNPLMDFLALIWLFIFLTRHRFHLIHTHETKASFLTRIANCKRQKPLIYGLHGIVFNDERANFLNWIYKKLEKHTICLADFVIAVGQDVRATYLAFGIGSNAKWKIIPSAIEVTLFVNKVSEEYLKKFRDNLNIPQKSFVWINVGRFSKSKKQSELLSIFFRFCDLTTIRSDLVFFGEGPEIEFVRSISKRRPEYTERVHFAGLREDIHDIAKIGNVHLFTSVREGTPRAVIECNLMSIPTISFEVDGIREIISTGESGFIISRGDKDAFIEAMKILAHNIELTEKMGAKAREFSLAIWDSRLVLQEMTNYYKFALQYRD